MKNLRTFISIVLLITCTISIACTKSDKQETTKAPAVGDSALPDFLSSYLPADTSGFISFDYVHQAAKQLDNSPWAKMITLDPASLEGSASKAYFEALKKSGIDPSSRQSWISLAEKSVGFVKGNSQNGEISFGLYTVGNSSARPGKNLSTLKEELKKLGFNIGEAQYATGEGFVVEIDNASVPLPGVSLDSMGPASALLDLNSTTTPGLAKPGTNPAAFAPKMTKLYIAWKDNMMAASSDKSVTEQILAGNQGAEVALLKDAKFENTRKQFVNPATAYVFGYFDLNRLKNAAATKKDGGTLSAIAVTGGMDDAPYYNIRAITDPAGGGESLAKALSGISGTTAEKTAQYLPKQTLLFVGLDGDLLRKALQQAGGGDTTAMFPQINEIVRIGVAARMAPLGQSLLPIPDLLVIAETKNSSAVKAGLESTILEGMQSQMPADMAWQDTMVAGKPAKSLASPAGVSVFITESSPFVIVGTSAPLLETALNSQGSLTKQLSKKFQDSIKTERSVANFYLDFAELASFMTNMKGLLSVYAPQTGGGDQEILADKTIEGLRGFGALGGSITFKEGNLDIRSSFSKQAGGPA